MSDHRMPGQLADDEQAARGLCIGKKEQIVFGDAGSDP
jgi:hypothetical protein